MLLLRTTRTLVGAAGNAHIVVRRSRLGRRASLSGEPRRQRVAYGNELEIAHEPGEPILHLRQSRVVPEPISRGQAGDPRLVRVQLPRVDVKRVGPRAAEDAPNP